MLPLIEIIIILRGKNIWLFRFTYLFLILFIWKYFIKRIAVCWFLRSHILVRVSKIMFLASPPPPPPKRYYSINRWTHIVNMTGFTIHYPSNIYLVDNFLNIAYAKNWVIFVFKVDLLRFFPTKPFSRKSWELVGSSKSTDQFIFSESPSYLLVCKINFQNGKVSNFFNIKYNFQFR